MTTVPQAISEGELKQLLTETPAVTRTYEIDAEVHSRALNRPPGPVRQMNGAEIAELADYLGVEADLLVGPFEVTDATCQKCGRRRTFLDFAKSGVDAGVHSRPELAAILTSRDRAWVTIVGSDGGRQASCAKCGSIFSTQENSYHSGAYDYDFPGHW